MIERRPKVSQEIDLDSTQELPILPEKLAIEAGMPPESDASHASAGGADTSGIEVDEPEGEHIELSGEPVELLDPKSSGEGDIFITEIDATPAELRKSLAAKIAKLVGGAKKKISEGISSSKENFEKSKAYLANRSSEIDAEAGEQGKIEKYFRVLGEKYNKLNWKQKLAVGAALGLGAAASAGVSAPTALLFSGGLAAQRVAGLAGRFLKAEKKLQNKESGLFAKKEKAMMAAMLYTLGMGAAIKEGVTLASESVQGEWVHEWLRHHWPFGQAESPTMSGAPTHHAEITQAPSAPVETEAAPAPEVPEIPAVNAAHGMGGIKMIEELQRHIHTFAGTDESHLSDMQKHILHGDATKLAEEYKLYDPNAASNMQSAFITEDSTLGFDGRGNLVLTPHGGEASVLDADHPYAGPHMQPPAPETPHPVAAPVAEQSQGTSVAPVTEPYASLHDPSSGPAQTFAAPDTPHAIETGVSDNIIHNSFGLDIHTDQAHIYSLDAKAKHLFVFGGETNDKLKIISQYWKTNPKGVVYEVEPDTKNAKHIYRFAWRLVNGAPVKESPARTSSFLSIFSPWKGDIEPRNFRKLIQ